MALEGTSSGAQPLWNRYGAILLDSFYGRPFVELTERIDVEISVEKPTPKAKAAKAEAKQEVVPFELRTFPQSG